MSRALVLFSSSDTLEKDLLNGGNIYTLLRDEKDNTSPQFHILDPNNGASLNFKEILAKLSQTHKIAVACHISQEIIEEVWKILEKNKTIKVTPFHHENKDPVWNDLRPFLQDIKDNKQFNDNLFDTLWRMLAHNIAEEARILRSKILYPLVALDWCEQLEPRENLNDDLLSDVKKEIKSDDIFEIRKKFELLKSNEINKPLNILIEIAKSKSIGEKREDFYTAAKRLDEMILALEERQQGDVSISE